MNISKQEEYLSATLSVSILLVVDSIAFILWNKVYREVWEYTNYIQKNLDYFASQNNFIISHKATKV